MSTNYYIRRTKPILTFPEFHIGKRSYGWRGLFEANSKMDDTFEYETERPVIHSLDDIKSYVESGEWEIVDYGEDFTVEIVNSFPDVRVEFVDSFPGVE